MNALYAADVLGTSVYDIPWFFVAYSFLGVVIEALFFLACERVLESRTGLLYLPLRPLYGVGGCAFAVLLRPLAGHPALVFVLGGLVATVVEYLASLLTDKMLGAVSWDYSGKLLNLHGRVCLAYSLCWGGLALVALYLLDQPILHLLEALTPRTGEAVLTVLLVLVLLSAALTLVVLARTRARVSVLRAVGQGAVPQPPGRAWGRLVDRLAPDPVLINSFPRMSLITELLQLTGQQRGWIRLPALGLRAGSR